MNLIPIIIVVVGVIIFISIIIGAANAIKSLKK